MSSVSGGQGGSGIGGSEQIDVGQESSEISLFPAWRKRIYFFLSLTPPTSMAFQRGLIFVLRAYMTWAKYS